MFKPKGHIKNYVNKEAQTHTIARDYVVLCYFFGKRLPTFAVKLEPGCGGGLEGGMWTASVSLLRPVFCVPIAVRACLKRSLDQESQEREICITQHKWVRMLIWKTTFAECVCLIQHHIYDDLALVSWNPYCEDHCLLLIHCNPHAWWEEHKFS